MFTVSELEHTADKRFRIEADSFAEMLKASLNALNSILFRKNNYKFNKKSNIFIREKNNDELFVEFLRKILFIDSSYNEIVIDWDDEGSEWGEYIKGNYLIYQRREDRIIFESEVKAITYNDLIVRREADIFTAEFVFDV